MEDDEALFFNFFNLLGDSEAEERQYIESNNLLICTSAVRRKFKRRRTHVPRIMGYAENIIPNYSLSDFRTYFRVSREIFLQIVDTVGESLMKENRGGEAPVDTTKQVLIFLCYMANMESHREIGQYFGVCKATVYNVVRNVSTALVEIMANVIKWPSIDEQDEIAREFQLQCGLPNIIGVLDGSHIRLASCPKGDTDYINRKQFPSMQLQVVTDNNMLIRNVYTGWPGCTHDARVFRNSMLFSEAEAGNLFGPNRYIIADSAYPVKHWVIPPFRDNGHLSAMQRRFNTVLSSGRQVVERCFGHLKGRFRRLREITLHKPKSVVSDIVSGCILHNLTIINDDEIEQYLNEPDDDDGHPNQYFNIFQNAPDGLDKRDQLMRALP